MLNGRTESKLQTVADAIGKPEDVLVQPGDVSSEQDVERLIAATVDKFDRIDVLVNNAATLVMGHIDQVSYDDWNKQMAINAGGVFLTIKSALPYLERSGGAVVNVSSVSGLGGDWGLFAYNATKGAVSNVTRALALDLAARNIRVNAVAPSLTDTEMAEGVTSDDQVMQKFKDRIPMQRPAEPAEVADVIAFLASHDARFVNGVVLPVDGGLSASNGQPKLG
ncbi:SDR family oxidoreductase [Aeoliella sp. ICT_H6.2]|uniref:SDR family oxidoreductase n=1 Tax=Aeoliella straminimaris TaxID=2954799 RepID=A0A9X2F9V7_9BACT|nr:SDR family oxidoreductase [Aeoliella straminimaris]